MVVKKAVSLTKKLIALGKLPDASKFQFPKGKVVWQIQRKEKGKVLATAEKSSVTRWWPKSVRVIKLF